MKTVSSHSASDHVRDRPAYRPYYPSATLKCIGRALFRSRVARDYACLLDFDPDVVSWRCLTEPLVDDDASGEPYLHYLDFEVDLGIERLLVDVHPCAECPPWIDIEAKRFGCRYQAIDAAEFATLPRLQNAKDLLRYAGWEPALGDKIRILMALDDLGSLTLGECLSSIRDGKPMQSMAAMILKGIVTVDLNAGLLGPDTIIRRATSR